MSDYKSMAVEQAGKASISLKNQSEPSGGDSKPSLPTSSQTPSVIIESSKTLSSVPDANSSRTPSVPSRKPPTMGPQ
jgi:hypothetical protein